MSDIELIKSKLDIVEVIASYVPELNRAGANFKARCPFHSEKSPSFMVNPSLQIFKCFGCGKAGDVIKFIQEIERLEFAEALKVAAEKAGVEMNQTSTSKDERLEAEKKELIRANTLAAKFYNYILKTHYSGKDGREYAQKRKIDGKRIDDFLIGFATPSRTNLKKFLLSKGFNEKDLVKWGLLVERDETSIDKFRNRLLQPIFNLKGEVVGFSGRYVGSSKLAPKYLNSPETLVYKKNEMLYGFFQAKEEMRKKNFVILVEGNIDILSSHRVGIKNIVAPLGTAFTINQAKLIKRFCDEVYFSFDTDEAGTKALIRGIEIVEQVGLTHKVIDLTGYQDGDELICKNEDEWVKRIEGARNSVEYLIDKLSNDLDLGKVEDKRKFSKRIFPVLKMLKNHIDINHFVKQVSFMLEVSETDVMEEIVEGTKSSTQKKEELNFEAQVKEAKVSTSRKLEIYFLRLLIQTNKIFSFQEIGEDLFQDEVCKIIFKEFVNAGEDVDFGKVAEHLEDDAKTILEDIIMNEVGEVSTLDKEINQTLIRLKKKFYKKEILKLRKLISLDSENIEHLTKLQEYGMKLQEIERLK